MATHAPARVSRGRRAELLHGVYVIVNETTRTMELARAVLAAGVRVVQYRAKSGIVAETLRALRDRTREHDALLILNDDWRAAVQFDCDGVHLGPQDDGFADVAAIRAAARELVIGLSCGTLEELRAANDSAADYLGAGPVYATFSKEDAGAPIGIEGLRALVSASRVPVAAIGGIGTAALGEIRSSGAAMAAVISAISDAPEPYRAAAQLMEAWQR
jgi:thiamine-phosphate diphosphorylase